MKQIILVITFIWLCCSNAHTQSVTGITGQRDTSFSTYSAFRSALKTNPAIKIVEAFHLDVVAEKKDIPYCKTGERKLLLDAFYPKQKNKTKQTAIIIIHGGGWRSGSREQHYPLAQQLANLGYICFTPEYRLSTEALYPAAVTDIKSAIKWVKKNAKEYNVDTNKIAVLGFSSGGELAAFMGTTNCNADFETTDCNTEYSTTVQAIIDIDGILAFIHPESGEGDDSKKTSSATYWFGYSKTENPELWKQASPLTYAGKSTPPTLFINSSIARMHAGREDYIKILTANNTYTEVRSFENSPHSFCLFEPWFEKTVFYIDYFLMTVFKSYR
jgi:acetyl esterase/lipase